MADNRFNQLPNVGYGPNTGFPMGLQSGLGSMPGGAPFMAGGMPVSPMIQQQMVMASGMRYPMQYQGMRMGVPATPPPPYSAHVPNSGSNVIPNRPRASLNKAKEGPQSQKERFFEEQRQKLKQFNKAGAVKVDTDKLIGSMFNPDVGAHPAHAGGKTVRNHQKSQEEDEGFGDFLQGPVVPPTIVNSNVKTEGVVPTASSGSPSLEPQIEPQAEKKDLKSMMLEYSDLSAPKKAKGFHKQTLNEVQKSGRANHRVSSFHESDHSRSWRHNTPDLEGLFQLPVAAQPTSPPFSGPISPEGLHHHHQQQQQSQMVYFSQPVIPQADTTFFSHSGVSVGSPVGPPPPYYERVSNGSPGIVQGVPLQVVGQPGPGELGRSKLPDWLQHGEDLLPPVYKQVWEASISDGKISTERLYPILLLSGLPREKLAQVWSMCNTATPGQLTKVELWMVLALIALTQNNYSTTSPDILARCPVAPVPYLAPAQDLSSPDSHNTTHLLPSQPASQSPAILATMHTLAPVGTSQQQTLGLQHPALGPQHSTHLQHSTHVQHSSHVVQHPRVVPHSSLPFPAVSNTVQLAANTVSDDDDFSDFKAASSLPVSIPPVTAGKGHTSPSFEDDDFTDGRDSLSQVSTSEQSENDDIRNLENYIEEYHQQKEKPTPGLASPLHCPFPAFQQNQTAVTANKPTLSSQQIQPGHPVLSEGDNKNFIPVVGPLIKDNSAVPRENKDTLARLGQHSKFIPPVGDLSKKVLNATEASSGINRSELGHFQMSLQSSAAALSVSASQDVTLIGDEDKYSALRALNQDLEPAGPSLFESPGQGLPEPIDSLSGVKTAEDDDWADFSAAPSISGNSASQGPTATQLLAAWGSTESEQSGKHQILAVDNNSSRVIADSSSFSHRNGLQEMDAAVSHGFLNKPNLLGFPASSGLPGTTTHAPDLDLGNMLTVEEDWQHFSKNSTVTDSPKTLGMFSASLPSLSQGPSTGTLFPDLSLPGTTPAIASLKHSNLKTEAEDDEWCDFSSAADEHIAIPSSDSEISTCRANVITVYSSQIVNSSSAAVTTLSSGGVVGGSNEEADLGDTKGKFVTIKKQNLGPNEIMGLFKVRSDPTTLSSYQLPAQQAGKTVAGHTQEGNHTRSPSLCNRKHSDFDDDSGPPPLDFGHDEDFDDHTFSRGYDLDDFMQPNLPTTTYSSFGLSLTSPLYSRAGSVRKLAENKEDTASVHSLDLPSINPPHTPSSDSQSVSSADLTNGELPVMGTGVVSAESKSLDSLDFRSENGDVENSQGGNQNGHPDTTTSPKHHPAQQHTASSPKHHPIQPQELLDTMPDFADRYNIEREAQGSDRYGHEWERCLRSCCTIIWEANTLFNTIDSSSVCNEVLRSSQGSQYVACVIEIYRVVCRVLTAMRFTAISTSDLELTLKNIDLAWNNLTAFLVGMSLLPEENSLVFTGSILKSDSQQAQQLACGLCLLNVDASIAATSSTNSCKLTYAGRQYHSTCANFWVNCVDQTLPSLTLPDLL